MTKEEVRKKYLKKRILLSSNEIAAFSNQIFFQWKNSNLSCFNSYHIFLPISDKNEVDTFPIIYHLWSICKKVYCSKVTNDSLLHYELTSNTELKRNSWGIPEPYKQKNIFIKRIDCIFIPLLAYDILGNRVGYGKGYYDNFLKDFPTAKKIGLSFFEPISLIESISPSDIPLNYIITPNYSSDFPMEVK